MMQSLRTPLNAAGVLALGERSSLAATLHDRSFKDKTVPVFPRSAKVSYRSTKKLIVTELHRPPAFPLFAVTILPLEHKNSDRWKRSGASPSPGTASNSHYSGRTSKEIISRSGNQTEAHTRNNSLETDHTIFTNERWLNSAEKKGLIHVSYNLVPKPVIGDDRKPENHGESSEESSNAEKEIQADSDRGRVVENDGVRFR